jgi:PIN domain nuclease of toxin-antitoxin system
MAIKIGIGKLEIGEAFDTFIPKECQRNQIELLPITFAQITRVTKLPSHHRDPFDRLLIAQALTEGLPIVSADSMFDAYPITRLW